MCVCVCVCVCVDRIQVSQSLCLFLHFQESACDAGSSGQRCTSIMAIGDDGFAYS